MTGQILPTKILLAEPPKEQEKKTASGIFLPDVGNNRPLTSMATVVLVGEGTLALPTYKIKIGDRVLFSPHAATRVEIEKKEYLLLDIQHVLYVY